MEFLGIAIVVAIVAGAYLYSRRDKDIPGNQPGGGGNPTDPIEQEDQLK